MTGIIPTVNIYENIELSGVVIVGEESAKRLTKVLGRKVEVGEEFDLGLLAVYRKDAEQNEKDNLEISRKTHLFS